MSSQHEIDTILGTLRMEVDPELAPLFYQFEEFYEQKLWHQLTESLTTFFADPRSVPLRLRVYDTFVTKFYDKINQLKAVDFLLSSLKSNEDYEERLGYLTDLSKSFDEIDEKKTRNDGLQTHEVGKLLIKVEVARLYLYQQEIIKARDLLDDLEVTLEHKDAIPLRVTSAFYHVNAEYYRIKNDFNTYYYTSLLYLSSLDSQQKEFLQNDMPEQKQLAYNLSLAALLGDKIYNFGELLNHPILQSISDDPSYKWLFQLLDALTVGDFDRYDKIINVQIKKLPILAEHEVFLRQKICLMGLVESVFEKSIRTLSFDDVAAATHLSKQNVEHLVMKAISLGLLKGSIDQVNELVSITWVQPRIINNTQIIKMRDRLVDWNEEVDKLATKMDAKGAPIWV